MLHSRSSDGKILIVSSTDGYCSIIQFQDRELGEIYKAQTPLASKNEEKQVKESSNHTTPTKPATPAPFIELDSDAMDVDISKCDKLPAPPVDRKKSDVPVDSKLSKKVENDDKKIENVNGQDKTSGSKVNGNDICEDTEDIKLVYEESNAESAKTSSKHTPKKIELPTVKTPRRVQLITLSSPKHSNKKE